MVTTFEANDEASVPGLVHGAYTSKAGFTNVNLVIRRYTMRYVLSFILLLTLCTPATAEKKSSPLADPERWSGSAEEILVNLAGELQRLDPDDSRTLARAGELLLRAGKTAEAAEVFQRAQASDRKDDEAFVIIADAYSMQGMWAEADVWYQEAVARDPKDADHLGLWGGSYWKRGDRDKAIELFVKALRMEPTSKRLHYRIGRTIE